METLEFAPGLHLGVDLIDQQHGQFFKLMNQLIEADAGDEHQHLVADIIGELSDYVTDHFGTEEELMARFEYPELEVHKELHAQFAARVEGFKQAFASGEIGLEDQIMGSLVDWFTSHVMQEDMKYLELFRENGL